MGDVIEEALTCEVEFCRRRRGYLTRQLATTQERLALLERALWQRERERSRDAAEEARAR